MKIPNKIDFFPNNPLAGKVSMHPATRRRDCMTNWYIGQMDF